MSQNKVSTQTDIHDSRVGNSIGRYWHKNMLITTVLLIIWAVVGLGCGVLITDLLNNYNLGGFPLGFWFAQQGSILVFVLLILVYAILLNRLDTQHSTKLNQFQK